MKDSELAVHGVVPISTWGGYEISIVDGEDFLFWRDNFGIPRMWHRSKIFYSAKGEPYFKARGVRVYLKDALHV